MLFQSEVPSLGQHYVLVPLVYFTTAVPLPFGALGLSEEVSEQLFRLVGHPGSALVLDGGSDPDVRRRPDLRGILPGQQPTSPRIDRTVERGGALPLLLLKAVPWINCQLKQRRNALFPQRWATFTGNVPESGQETFLVLNVQNFMP